MSQPPIYRQAALEKYKSPQPLDDLPRLTPVHAWSALAALALLISALLLWGLFGTLITSVEVHGIAQAGTLTFQLDARQAAQVRTGMPVYALCADVPFTGSVQAIRYNNNLEQFEISSRLEPFSVHDAPCSAAVITRQERPIERVLSLNR